MLLCETLCLPLRFLDDGLTAKLAKERKVLPRATSLVATKPVSLIASAHPTLKISYAGK